MILLKSVMEFLGLKLGLDKRQAIEENYPINCKSMSTLVIFFLSTLSCGIHLFFEANTFIEYTYSIAAFSSMLVALVVFVIIIFIVRDLYVGLDDLAETVTKSKYDTVAQTFFFWTDSDNLDFFESFLCVTLNRIGASNNTGNFR